jgi:hypothetical protein
LTGKEKGRGILHPRPFKIAIFGCRVIGKILFFFSLPKNPVFYFAFFENFSVVSSERGRFI